MSSELSEEVRKEAAGKLREAAALLEKGDVATAGKIVLDTIPPLIKEAKRVYGPFVRLVLEQKIKDAFK